MVMPMVEWPDLSRPTAPPTRADELTHGVDCIRHAFLGCIINHSSGTPEQQARNYLLSLAKSGAISRDEFQAKMRGLEMWERSNFIVMPPRLAGFPVSGETAAQRQERMAALERDAAAKAASDKASKERADADAAAFRQRQANLDSFQ